MNTIPCGQCANYVPHETNHAGVRKPSVHRFGTCKKLTVYPATAAPNHNVPLDAVRAAPGTLPRPDQVKIVDAGTTIRECVCAARLTA